MASDSAARSSWPLISIRIPFRTWPDRPRLVARLLDQALGQQESASAQGSLEAGQGAQTVTDLVSQLRIALDRFARVRLVPFALMAGLITGYIILVGPLDYWWLKRRQRLEWTWLTFPLIVVLFVGLAAALALAWKGRSLPGASGGNRRSGSGKRHRARNGLVARFQSAHRALGRGLGGAAAAGHWTATRSA